MKNEIEKKKVKFIEPYFKTRSYFPARCDIRVRRSHGGNLRRLWNL